MKFNKRQILHLIKIFSVFFLIIMSLWFVVSKNSRRKVFSYFSTRCIDYRQKDYSAKLRDRLVDYISAAKRSGIRVCRNDKELKQRISDGSLVKIRSGRFYIVDKLTFSHPYLTKDSESLLDEIGKRYREKTSAKGLIRVKFYITSMTRKSESLKKLRRLNSNASANSPHIYGNAFDISYKRFDVHKMYLTNCDHGFLKEVLAEVIWQLRKEGKCWATYEREQGCFHIVAR